jgi:glycosyltransferase involved in cell wall biosynthesis
VIRAIARIPDAYLLIAGDGPERARLGALVDELGVGSRVRFTGVLGQAQINELFSACDASVLASSQEGWANVLLESMASGTPVVASQIEGTREVVCAPEAGVLVERTPEAIAGGLNQVLSAGISPQAVRSFAERFSWEATSRGQMQLFQRITGRHR